MTAILVTVGPATQGEPQLLRALSSGADVFRFAGSKQEPEELAGEASALARAAPRPVEMLLDLPGSKMRLTNDGGLELAALSSIRIFPRPIQPRRDGTAVELGVTGCDGDLGVQPGDVLLVGDGEDALKVRAAFSDHCECVPLTRGVLGRKRGLVVAGKPRRREALTDRDRKGLRIASRGPFTGVILSFVESPATIAEARAILGEAGSGAPRVVAKVETRAGVEVAGAIAAAADAVLLGRGDLLLDVGELDFFDAERRIIDAALAAGKPIVVGTDLLNSLSSSYLPNRSELSHLCWLLERGVHGLLLSRETTIGGQPFRTIELVDRLRRRHATRASRRLFEEAA